MNFDFIINLNFAFTFFNFLFYVVYISYKFENDLTSIKGDSSPFISAHL